MEKLTEKGSLIYLIFLRGCKVGSKIGRDKKSIPIRKDKEDESVEKEICQRKQSVRGQIDEGWKAKR